jgi:5-methylcytosine-specific restriction enzyme A
MIAESGSFASLPDTEKAQSSESTATNPIPILFMAVPSLTDDISSKLFTMMPKSHQTSPPYFL